jgi:hypothetical protein
VVSEDLESLLRWEGAGGTWEMVGIRGGCIELNLLTCGRDEVMGRLCSYEPDVREYVSKDDPGDV